MKMSPELFAKYAKDPLNTDEEVRRVLKIPVDKYYSVAMMNDVGVVTLTGSRVAKAPKISKSDQKSE
jgi:hypothetical protein